MVVIICWTTWSFKTNVGGTQSNLCDRRPSRKQNVLIMFPVQLSEIDDGGSYLLLCNFEFQILLRGRLDRKIVLEP